MASTVKEHAAKRPAGLTAVATTVVVFVAQKAGLDLSPEEAVAVVGGATAVVSGLYPRCLAYFDRKRSSQEKLEEQLVLLELRVRHLEEAEDQLFLEAGKDNDVFPSEFAA